MPHPYPAPAPVSFISAARRCSRHWLAVHSSSNSSAHTEYQHMPVPIEIQLPDALLPPVHADIIVTIVQVKRPGTEKTTDDAVGHQLRRHLFSFVGLLVSLPLL